MKYDTSKLDNVKILDRICDVYGFHQKVQLAHHFNIAASSLSNRYTRGSISFDFAAICSLETGADLNWILTGEGEQNFKPAIKKFTKSEISTLEKFTINENELVKVGTFGIDESVLNALGAKAFCVMAESKLYIVEESNAISDGEKLIDVDGALSIRELTVLPGKRLHVTGGKIPFECSAEDIRVLGKVAGVYHEVK